MASQGNTPGRAFYDRQIAYLRAKDIDGLIDSHYAEDAELIGFDVVVKGRAALKAHFRRYMELLGTITIESTDKFRETEDAVFFEATVATNLGRARVYDAFVLRDGKATHHFTGVLT